MKERGRKLATFVTKPFSGVVERLRKPSPYDMQMDELEMKHKLNIERAKQFVRDYVHDDRTLKMTREAESIFMALGSSLSDIAWLSSLKDRGYGKRENSGLLTGKQDAADIIRDRMNKDRPPKRK